jgi:3,4-dihydroxy 2-butanone 4-phosphate synthase/GTP cyclohydrolase II
MNIEEALKQFATGKFVIITDDESRENEGDLMLLAKSATAESVGFMVRYTSGVICVAMPQETATRLHLPPMVRNNQDEKRTAFTVSVDALEGLTTGISAHERAHTINKLADTGATLKDFSRPGHIFPLTAHPQLLRARRGHTEAGVVMARLVGANPLTAISELVNDDGSMMRGQNLKDFADAHSIPMYSIQELADYAEKKLPVFTVLPKDYQWARLPRLGSEWQIAVHTSPAGVEHAILKYGEPHDQALLRLHSECLTGDAFGSQRCDCGEQLARSFEAIEKDGAGYILYMRDHEGRGIGLGQKVAAYVLQDEGMDTVDANLHLGHRADERDWADAMEILDNLRVVGVRLLSNNPMKTDALVEHGIKVINVPLSSTVTASNRDYLLTKKNRMQHDLEVN